jgi:AraC-like DNA-binding protein
MYINYLKLFFDRKLSGTNIFFYETSKSSKNNKVKFSQNLICIMQAGEKQVANQSVSEKFNNKNLYILGAGNVLMTETTTADNKYRSILLFFSNEYLISFLQRHSLTLKRANDASFCFKATKDEFLLNFEKSLTILNAELTANNNLLKVKIDEILLYLHKKNPDRINDLFKSILNEDKKVLFTVIVQANLNNNLRIDEMAFLCNMSVSTFKRRFTEAYNTTPKQYFIAHKMQKAAVLLKQNIKPSEMYADLGYENLSAFSNEFRKHFGVSPKAYVQN